MVGPEISVRKSRYYADHLQERWSVLPCRLHIWINMLEQLDQHSWRESRHSSYPLLPLRLNRCRLLQPALTLLVPLRATCGHCGLMDRVSAPQSTPWFRTRPLAQQEKRRQTDQDHLRALAIMMVQVAVLHKRYASPKSLNTLHTTTDLWLVPICNQPTVSSPLPPTLLESLPTSTLKLSLRHLWLNLWRCHSAQRHTHKTWMKMPRTKDPVSRSSKQTSNSSTSTLREKYILRCKSHEPLLHKRPKSKALTSQKSPESSKLGHQLPIRYKILTQQLAASSRYTSHPGPET